MIQITFNNLSDVNFIAPMLFTVSSHVVYVTYVMSLVAKIIFVFA
jgi:hypothetical protein